MNARNSYDHILSAQTKILRSQMVAQWDRQWIHSRTVFKLYLKAAKLQRLYLTHFHLNIFPRWSIIAQGSWKHYPPILQLMYLGWEEWFCVPLDLISLSVNSPLLFDFLEHSWLLWARIYARKQQGLLIPVYLCSQLGLFFLTNMHLPDQATPPWKWCPLFDP